MKSKIYDVIVYGNNTIRLPNELLEGLNIRQGTKLIIKKTEDIGFVVCKDEYYSSWITRLNQECEALDIASKQKAELFFKEISKMFKGEGEKTKEEIQKV